MASSDKLVIIKYNAGNIKSVLYALERIGQEAVVTDNHADILSAEKVIFPGVGEASSAMAYLKERGLDQIIRRLQQPVLGICLGMQLMCAYSEENNTDCLGIFETQVKRFAPEDPSLKVPQIGWNTVSGGLDPLFNGTGPEPYCYFVHGYYAEICHETAATTTYGLPFSSALQKDNFYGLQFHPEKSSATGQMILQNFLSIKA
jgi:glutamine amidotransferase